MINKPRMVIIPGVGKNSEGLALKVKKILEKDFKKLSSIGEIKNRLAICFFQTEEQALPFFEDMKKRTDVTSMERVEKLNGKYAVSTLCRCICSAVGL